MSIWHATRILLDVNQKCIENGIAQTVDSCPIALAVLDYFGRNSCSDVCVETYMENPSPETKIIFCLDNKYYVGMPDKKYENQVNNFIGTFNDHGQVSPFQFVLVYIEIHHDDITNQ